MELIVGIGSEDTHILVSLMDLPSKKNASMNFCSRCIKALIFPMPFHIIGLLHLYMYDSGN